MPQTELAYYLVITFDIDLLQISQQFPTLLDHLQQSLARVVVFLMSFEMIGESVDALAQQRNLYGSRSGIGRMGAKIAHNLFFRFSC